ncbi:hypothetical protein CEXT_48351 [Caerostris extrusa]|uniref:Uncharacterized protein n=1 Tax=Caerostris extrusa TaxID=172846 RepID=A0AAV4N3C7_CAEEX|nr:hypothetical protein CEXT_48351 [Caerostris extrusa]
MEDLHEACSRHEDVNDSSQSAAPPLLCRAPFFFERGSAFLQIGCQSRGLGARVNIRSEGCCFCGSAPTGIITPLLKLSHPEDFTGQTLIKSCSVSRPSYYVIPGIIKISFYHSIGDAVW